MFCDPPHYHAKFNVCTSSLHTVTCITQVTLESRNGTLLIEDQWFCFTNFEFLVNFAAHEHGLNVVVCTFWLKSFSCILRISTDE